MKSPVTEPRFSARMTLTLKSAWRASAIRPLHQRCLVISAFRHNREFTTGYKLTELKSRLERIGIKHIIVHFDCCHAGGVFVPTHGRAPAHFMIDRMGKTPVVQAVTAVTAAEAAIERGGHGLFTRTICDQLASGDVFERHQRSFVTGTELFSSVCAAVMQEARSLGGTMTPMHKDIFTEHGGELCTGEMLFVRPT